MDNFGIYMIISNPVMSYERIAEICVEEEITKLQLREKNISDRQLISIGRRIIRITEGTKTNLIINDRPDIAYILNADGLHLGQQDLPLEIIQRDNILHRTSQQNRYIMGLSTHSLSQLRSALAFQLDYLAFGPIYATPTKEKPDPTVGTELLSKAVKLANVPLVAIGGIDDKNIDKVLKTGVQNVALVRYFMQSSNLKEKIKIIKNKIQSYMEEK